MKRILFIIAFCSPLLAQAQSIEHILKSIEQKAIINKIRFIYYYYFFFRFISS